MKETQIELLSSLLKKLRKLKVVCNMCERKEGKQYCECGKDEMALGYNSALRTVAAVIKEMKKELK